MDEIFGRGNFVNNVIWQKKFSPQNDAKWLSDNHDIITVSAKNKLNWNINFLQRSDEALSRYKNLDNDTRGVWTSSDLTVKRVTEKDTYEIITPSGKKILPTNGRSWSTSKNKMQMLINDNRVYFGENGENVPRFL
jgi:adenine-specific DNA-methyltransferase